MDGFEEFLAEFRTAFCEDFDITSVRSAVEGLALLDKRHFDAVVLDYEIADMDGLALLEAVREKWPFLPVLFCTRQASGEVARRVFTAGATDYFQKDFSLSVDRQRLMHAVRQAVEKRATVEALQRERIMLNSVIDLNPYSIEIFDRHGKIVRWNQAALDLWKAVPGEDYSVWDDPNLLEAGYGPLLDRVRKGEAIRFPTITYNPSRIGPQHPDRDVCAAGMVFPLMDARGEFDAMVVMHEDITARVQAEEALKESYAHLERRVEERTVELSHANRNLENEVERRKHLQKELENKNHELEDFSFRAGHDLKNNLLAIRSLLDLGRSNPAIIADHADAIFESSDRLIDFVERLLQMARAGRVIARKERVAPDPLACKVFERLAPIDPEAELEVHTPVAPVVADPAALEQILYNLFCNAFQNRDPARRLRVVFSTSEGEHRVEVRVRDNGRGIAPENLERIFGMCFTTNEHEHPGFGPAIVKKLVQAHGGSVRAESAGLGAEFIFDLPAPAAGSGPCA